MNVYLRAIETNDYLVFHKWRNDTQITDMLGGNRFFVSTEREKDWVANAINNDRVNLHLVICIANDKPVGIVNLTSINYLNRNAEFSILIGEKDLQGKSIGLKSTMLMLKHGFEELNLNKIWLTVLEDNSKAIKLYEKVGFKNEGLLRQEVYKNNKFHNMYVMSILKEEYDQRS